jgi:ABC-type antimicrobial peptide transport system permease subunit
MVRGLWPDLIYTARRIATHPVLSSVVILTMALGLGTNTAIFTVARTILLESLPVRAPHELVLLRWTAGPNPDVAYLTGEFSREPGTGRVSAASFSYPGFLRFAQECKTITALFASGRFGDLIVNAGGQAELADVELVSGSYFGALGVPIMVGRAITWADDRSTAAQVAVLSHDYWQRRFGRDPAVVGTTITIQATPFTIIGVAPSGFRGTMQLGSSFDVAVPLSSVSTLAANRPYLSHPKWYWLQVMGRVASTAPVAQAESELNALMPAGDSSARDRLQVAVAPGHQGLSKTREDQRIPVLLLTTIAGFILLLSCASVAALLVSRTEARTHEFTVRKALGATRWQIIRQPVSEGVTYALLGA